MVDFVLLERLLVNDVPVTGATLSPPLFHAGISALGPSLPPVSEDLLEGTMLSRNLKNVLVVSVGFLFLFMAAGGLQNLQVRRRQTMILDVPH